MTISNDQLTMDRDRWFDDWGEPIMLRHFTESIDPQTQQLIETAVDSQLTSIVHRVSSEPLGPSATRQLDDELQVFLKTEELPAGQPSPDLRVVYEGTEYSVVRFHRTGHGLVYELSCRKRL